MIKSKIRASNTLLNSAEYAITRKEQFSFLSCQDTGTLTYPDPPSPAKYQCASQLRGPGEDFLFLSQSYFSILLFRARAEPSLPLSVLLLSGWEVTHGGEGEGQGNCEPIDLAST